jgi:ABC-type lipoprotein export system ATPase subunit
MEKAYHLLLNKLDLVLNNIIPTKIKKDDLAKSSIWNKKKVFIRGGFYLVRSVSGKGKSTLINFLSGKRDDFIGKYFQDNQDCQLFNKSDWIQKRKNEIALVSQDLKLISSLSVLDNLTLKIELTNFIKIENIDQYLKQLGIQELKYKKCSSLSMGQQQRVAIIRSILQPFKWVLLDEPFSHLDEKNKKLSLDFVINHAQKQNAGIIISTLDIKEEYKGFKSIDL